MIKSIQLWGDNVPVIIKTTENKNRYEFQNQNIVLYIKPKITSKKETALINRLYNSILKEELRKILPVWEEKTGIICKTRSTKNMLTKWGECNQNIKKLWFNPQLAQKPKECLDYIVLCELMNLNLEDHSEEFLSKYMPDWREARRKLNDDSMYYSNKEERTPLQKLIDCFGYDNIQEAAISFVQKEKDSEQSLIVDLRIENAINIEQTNSGGFEFDFIASCLTESVAQNEHWIKIHCQLSFKHNETWRTIEHVSKCEPYEEPDLDHRIGSFVPLISEDDLEREAERFLKKYSPETFEKPVKVPIEQVVEQQNLQISTEFSTTDGNNYFGAITFEDGTSRRNRKSIICNAQPRTIFLNTWLPYLESPGKKAIALAHECYHWHKHFPYHSLMETIEENDDLGNAILCPATPKNTFFNKWKVKDWFEWQSNGIAPRIIMPAKTTRMKANELLAQYCGTEKTNVSDYEKVVDELAEVFGVSKQDARIRLLDLGYVEFDGVYPFIDGQYLYGYSFSKGSLDNKQSFTISYEDLFKAYQFNEEFRKLLESGKFVFIDHHIVLYDEKYVAYDDSGKALLTDYAYSHMDECCLAFSKGYTYNSVYQGKRHYMQFANATNSIYNNLEFYCKLSSKYIDLINLIKHERKDAKEFKNTSASFTGYLEKLIKVRKTGPEALSESSLVGTKTIYRLRYDEDYIPELQTLLGVCVGLKLTLPESEILLTKKGYTLTSATTTQGLIYRCVLSIFSLGMEIREINGILEKFQIKRLGSDKYIRNLYGNGSYVFKEYLEE